MEVLREYHAAMGELILSHPGTLERFAGDGMMIFFNDPVPVPNPAERALQLAPAMRERAGDLHERWRQLGYDLGVAIGIATGYATIGAIGFDGRWDYGAIGTVTNLAARLCVEAGSGQILISRRLSALVPAQLEVAPAGDLALRGFARPGVGFQRDRDPWTSFGACLSLVADPAGRDGASSGQPVPNSIPPLRGGGPKMSRRRCAVPFKPRRGSGARP